MNHKIHYFKVHNSGPGIGVGVVVGGGGSGITTFSPHTWRQSQAMPEREANVVGIASSR